jgi:hypothetical protein
MPVVVKGINKVATILHDWTEEDRQDAIDFAMHPGNGVTTVALYLHNKGVKVSLNTVSRWLTTLTNESQKIARMRKVFEGYKGLTPNEINAFIAGVMAEALVEFQDKIRRTEGERGIDLRDIQALTSLAKEARVSAQAMNTPYSSASMQELELGLALSFTSKLEDIFASDEVCWSALNQLAKQFW